MSDCKNRTCSAQSKTAYCSRRCQLAARNIDHRRALPDVRVDMDLYRLLATRADVLGLTVLDLMNNLIEAEVNYGPDLTLFELAS